MGHHPLSLSANGWSKSSTIFSQGRWNDLAWINWRYWRANIFCNLQFFSVFWPCEQHYEICMLLWTVSYNDELEANPAKQSKISSSWKQSDTEPIVALISNMLLYQEGFKKSSKCSQLGLLFAPRCAQIALKNIS